MRIRDLTEERLDEGPIWDKVKSGVKKIFTPAPKKNALETNSRAVKDIFYKLIKGEKLNRQDMALINSIYKQI